MYYIEIMYACVRAGLLFLLLFLNMPPYSSSSVIKRLIQFSASHTSHVRHMARACMHDNTKLIVTYIYTLL